MLKRTGKVMNLKSVCIMAVMLCCFVPVTGLCFEVSVHVDKNRISKDDAVVMSVEVNGGKAELDLSMITDFKVISRGTGTSMNYINGRLEKKASYQYILIPLSEGRLKIPPIKATLDGEIRFSQEVVVQVVKQVVDPDGVKSLFATAAVTEKKLFSGQQSVYTLKFFTSKRLSGLAFETPPVFSGFSHKVFEKEKSYGQIIQGIQYQVTEVNYLLIPREPGVYTIDPAVLTAQVVVRSRRDPRFDSIFNDSVFGNTTSKPVRVASNPVEIEVLQLPGYQGEGTFSGLVGSFNLTAALDTPQIKDGESATLTLEISGRGNIMDAGLPDVELDEQIFKVYDDNPEEKISLGRMGYEGSKIFKKAVVPVRPGEYVIPSVSLVFFDVEKQTYRSVSTDPIPFNVKPSGQQYQAGASVPDNTNTPALTFDKKEVRYENKDIFDIKEGGAVLEQYRDIPVPIFILLLAIPLCGFFGVKLITALRRKDVPIEKQMEEKALRLLKKADKADRSRDDFLGSLYGALVARVLSRTGKKGESVTMAEVRRILGKQGVEPSGVDEVVSLFETIDSVRFGGRKIDENQAGSLLARTRSVFKLICAVMVFTGLFLQQAPIASADSTATFIKGVEDYRAGDFESAARLFEEVAVNGIQNPYLYYNIANAYLKSGHTGHAILWYERAKKFLPDDPDLNFNLSHARSFVKDKTETSPGVMDIVFFWDTLLRFRTIQLAAVLACCLFFSWASVQTLRRKRVFSGTGIALLSALVLIAVVICEHHISESARPGAVIVVPEASVRSGISEASTKLFSLHEGTKVVVTDQRDGYLKIVFSKEKSGWIKAGNALRINALPAG